MKRVTLLLSILSIALFWALVPVAGRAAAENGVTPIQDLIENMKKYDGDTVTIEGEAIGEAMTRGEYAWITVDDDPYSTKSREEGGEFVGMSNIGMSVWITRQDAKLIKYFGGYKYRGDKVRITGIFHRACEQHGGDTDIHGDTLEVLREGHRFPKPLSIPKLLAVIVLAAAIAVLWNVRKVRARRSPPGNVSKA